MEVLADLFLNWLSVVDRPRAETLPFTFLGCAYRAEDHWNVADALALHCSFQERDVVGLVIDDSNRRGSHGEKMKTGECPAQASALRGGETP